MEWLWRRRITLAVNRPCPLPPASAAETKGGDGGAAALGASKRRGSGKLPISRSLQDLQLADMEGRVGEAWDEEAAVARAAASALPFKPLAMTFSDVAYSVPFPPVRLVHRA